MFSAGDDTALRPKNESKPPDFLPLPSFSGAGASACFSTIRQPGGESSWTTASGLDFRAVSQAVDPFDAIKRDIGLDRTRDACLVARIASIMCFDVAVWENGIEGGNVGFSVM